MDGELTCGEDCVDFGPPDPPQPIERCAWERDLEERGLRQAQTGHERTFTFNVGPTTRNGMGR